MKRITAPFFVPLVGAVLIALTGCSYRAVDDTLRGFIQDTEQESQFYSAPEIKTIDKKVGETQLHIVDGLVQGSMEITLKEKNVFDSIDASGIDMEECTVSPLFSKEPERFCFILLDVEIYNIDAALMDDYDEKLPFSISTYFPITEVKVENSEMGRDLCEIVYFSEHPPITDTSTDYYHYNILPGERLTCQMGIMAPKIDYENDNLWLGVGGGTGRFFELFD